MQPADDFTCQYTGWDQRVVEELDVFDDYDGVVWFFDGYQPNIDTLSIMGRKYYERFNYIYYPCYRTFFWCSVMTFCSFTSIPTGHTRKGTLV
jgi:hypothetical protein